MNNTLVKVALGVGSVIFAGLVAKKVIHHKTEKKTVKTEAKQKKEKKQKEKSEIHPRVRAQIAMAQASAKIAEFVLKNQDKITAATKVLTFGAAVLGFVRAGKKLVDDKKMIQDLAAIKDDIGYLKSKDYTSGKYREIWLKGWHDSTQDVLSIMREASERKTPFWMSDNPDGDYCFKVEQVEHVMA